LIKIFISLIFLNSFSLLTGGIINVQTPIDYDILSYIADIFTNHTNNLDCMAAVGFKDNSDGLISGVILI